MKAVFLDRDGVINVKAPDGQYVSTWREVRFLPGVFPSTLRLTQAGFKLIIVTNQRGAALQKILPADLDEIHTRMKARFAEHGAPITDIYFCPHDIPENCSCRKPQPGMLFQAARDYALDLPSCWMIGDADSDIEAGLRAGCRTVRIITDEKPDLRAPRAHLIARELQDAVRAILGLDTPSPC